MNYFVGGVCQLIVESRGISHVCESVILANKQVNGKVDAG